jgi:hypothetical protein
MHVMAAADELVRHPELPDMAQSTRQQITKRSRAERLLSEVVPVYAAPDQGVCGVDM